LTQDWVTIFYRRSGLDSLAFIDPIGPGYIKMKRSKILIYNIKLSDEH